MVSDPARITTDSVVAPPNWRQHLVEMLGPDTQRYKNRIDGTAAYGSWGMSGGCLKRGARDHISPSASDGLPPR